MLRLSDLTRCAWFVLFVLMTGVFILIHPVSLSAAEYDPEKIFVEINWNQRADGTSDTWYGIYFFDLDNFDLSTVESITMRGPSNSPVYRYTRGGGDQNDFVENQWNGFHVQISNPDPAKGPTEGTYTFEVVTDDFSTTVTHVRDQNIEMPVLDAGTLSPADGTVITSRIPVFEWGAIEDSPVPVYYRFHIWDQNWASRVYASGRFADLRSIALPEGVLQPGQTYNWGVQILDSSDHTRVENLYLTEYLTITMAENVTDRTSPPAIDMDGWGVWNASKYGFEDDSTGFWVKVIDHDGIAYDGSSHQVSVTFNGQSLPLNLYRYNSAFEAVYENFLWIDPQFRAGEYVFTVTDPEGNTGTAAETLVINPLAIPDHNAFSVVENGTSPVFTWDPVPGAHRYRIRIRDADWNIVWHGYHMLQPDMSYTMPPGILLPHTQYYYQMFAWDNFPGFDVDNTSSSISEMVFTTGAVSENPLIEIEHGAATRNSGDQGTYLYFWSKVHDAQGVSGDNQSDDYLSVTATLPDGTTIPLELDYNESDTCGIYYAEDFGLPIAAGEYTITVEDMDGNTHSVTDILDVNPIGFPSDDTVHAAVNGTRVDVTWEEIDGAAFYRLEIHDMDGNRLHNMSTTQNAHVIPAGYLKENTSYQYRITTWRESFGQEIDNSSRSVMKVFETGLNLETDMQALILSTEIPNATISRGQSAFVYGTGGINEITLESGAYAELINFPGSNAIRILSDAGLFTVSRTGTMVRFEGPDGTVCKIPATTRVQTIVFNDRSVVLQIHDNQVKIDDQVIGMTVEAIR